MNAFEVPLWQKLVALWLLLNVVVAIRAALRARRYGRRPWLWFIITMIFSAIPEAFLALRHKFGWLIRGEPPPPRAEDRPATVRCPHCGDLFSTAELPEEMPEAVCPRCRLVISEEVLG